MVCYCVRGEGGGSLITNLVYCGCVREVKWVVGWAMAYYILALPIDRTGIIDNCAMEILQ